MADKADNEDDVADQKKEAEEVLRAPEPEWPLKIKLRKPVQAHGEEVTELTLREPTGADIEAAGNPVNIDMFSGDTVKITFDEKKMLQMIARLAVVPPSTIRMMNTKDWNSTAWQLVRFFTPDL